MIDSRPLVPNDGTIGRGYDGWRCGTIRRYFTPNKRIAIALYAFNSPGSFAFPIVYGVLSVPGCKEFLIAPREDPMSRICPLHIQVRPGNVATNFRTWLDLAVLNLYITRAKFPLFPWYKLTPCGRTFFLRHVSDAPPSSHL